MLLLLLLLSLWAPAGDACANIIAIVAMSSSICIVPFSPSNDGRQTAAVAICCSGESEHGLQLTWITQILLLRSHPLADTHTEHIVIHGSYL